ncbi:MAG TPA: glycolate oxidase subunit GlcE [Stellaceae bacterium]|nr:glycolate oxidase subunit GlcE [Stellaceae bacterium]
MARFTPTDIEELRDAIGAALAAEEPLELLAGGTKRGLGRPLQGPHTLDLSRLSGIRDYAPSELVLTAAAATPLAEIEAALAEAGQMLAFEPPDWGALYGLGAAAAARRSLGGVLACNLSGPRRVKAGAARDHFLGFRAVNGRGEIFKAGGKVVKNVTGYDLPKLMAGSFGTLAALEEVTVKVLPQPEQALTVVLPGPGPSAAVARLNAALASPHEVSGAAYLPAVLAGGVALVLLRLEGPPPSVAFRRDRLIAEFGADCRAAVLEGGESAALWRAIRDAEPLAGLGDGALWRVSAAPSRGAEIAEAIAESLDAAWYLDWGGGLVWAAVPRAEDGGSAAIRAALRGADNRGSGHATLIRGAPGLRAAVPVFEPQPAPLAALAARVKESFDPRRILNRGRMIERD